MNRKILVTALIVATMALTLAPLASVTGAGIPNPDQIFYTTFGGPETGDPGWAYDTASATLIQNVYEPLFMYEKLSTTSFVPLLADTWPGFATNPGHWITPSSPDPTAPAGTTETWYFHIRPNVKWQDSKYGTLTPADVEYSIERGMLQDHTGGPQWMLYQPLVGKISAAIELDENKNGIIDQPEYEELAEMVDHAVDSNATHVWFNLPGPFAPFMQILTQAWGMVICKQWAIDNGCWKGNFADYADFIRTYDPPAPGPLWNPPVAMGTGPYKLAAINTDPHTGFEVYEKFDDYWQGWPAPGSAGFVKTATHKNVEEWANRKAQFFSTDPGLQADISEVPRPNVPEVHIGGNKDGPTYPGFQMEYVNLQTIGSLYFVFNVTQPSDYTPKLGPDLKPDLFSDRNLRMAFMHCFNATQFILEYWLGEAFIPTTCMAKGTAFYNDSKPTRNIDLTKAAQYFQAAWGGQVWSKGITVKIEYNIGNRARQTISEMLADVIMHRIPWPAGVPVTITPTGVPWSNYMVDMPLGKLSVFIVGWLADYPDPHNWFTPFMDPVTGDYAARAQRVVYGMDPTGMAANWYGGASYGPPPYTNALGEKVTEINNTYIRHIITTAVGALAATREKLYNELMDIAYADATQMPAYQAVTRLYQRSWVNGFAGTYNENSLAVGNYYYTMWKAPKGTVFNVDVSAAGSITNITTAYPYVQDFDGEMRMLGKPGRINYTLHVKYVTGTVDIYVEIAVLRNSTTGTYYYPIILTKSLGPGEDYTVDVSWYEVTTMTAGDWTVSLYVTPMGTAAGEVTDTDTANNKVDSPYIVKTRIWNIDINGDGVVSILDIAKAALAFGTVEGDKRWNAAADIDGNGKVNIVDISKIARFFGTNWATIASTLPV